LKSLKEVHFEKNNFDPGGVAVLPSSFIEHCPALTSLYLPEVGSDTRQTIKGIRAIFGRQSKLTISLGSSIFSATRVREKN